MRRDVVWVHRRNDNCNVRDSCGVTTISTNDTEHARSALLRQLQGSDQVRAYVFLQATPAHGENEKRVFVVKAAAFEPLSKDSAPTFIVRPRGQFRNIIGRGIAFQPCDLSKIVDGMRSVSRTAA